MHINNLVIETTRRCQLECPHCLRGDAEDINMNSKYLWDLLEGVTRINTVTFTGGEPFLYPNTIEAFISICAAWNIEVNSFFIASNGIIFEPSIRIKTKTKTLQEQSLLLIIKLYTMCPDKEMCSIRISNTPWHYSDISDNNLLTVFSFAHFEGEDWTDQSLIHEGRGWGTRIEKNELDWDYPEELMVCLNCNGKVVWNCNLSYETQEDEGVSINEARRIIQKCNKLEEEAYA